MKWSLMIGVIFALLLSGCARTATRETLLEGLPNDEGMYGGKSVIQRWVYHGSDATYHYLTYTYTIDNLPRHTAYRVPHHIASMVSPIPYDGQARHPVSLRVLTLPDRTTRISFVRGDKTPPPRAIDPRFHGR
jgi:hypothetical protein